MEEKLRNGYPYLPKDKRKTILFLSDDMQVPSGVGTMSREIVFGTCHHYNWVQIGAAINHPYKGQIIDMNDVVTKETGVLDPSVKIYPYEGYGDARILNQILTDEKPDCILHFTDPRQFIWLYMLENEVRQKIPIAYYTIWDAPPAPHYNKPFYLSSDLHMCISKQTQNLIKIVVGDEMDHSKITYVPHGIDHTKFYPMEYDKSYIAMDNMYTEIFGKKELNFIVLFHNRNMRRKCPTDLILAFKHFVNELPEDKADKCALLFHTNPLDENGTNLYEVAEDIAPECNIYFYQKKLSTKELCTMYNLVDVTCNIANAEGFGLSNAESMMCGTPIVATVTGGLQDQMGFVDSQGNPMEFDSNFTSNHVKDSIHTYSELYGKWAYPVWPSSRHLTGSLPTPYIFEDYVNYHDVSDGLIHWYNMTKEERKIYGAKGRQWMIDKASMTSEHMCANIIANLDDLLMTWKPKTKYTLTKFEKQPLKNPGIIL